VPLDFDLAIPTCGRPELDRLLAVLASLDGPSPRRVLVVDDRPDRDAAAMNVAAAGALPVVVLRSHGQGPAAARNAALRASDAEFLAFLDDDVVPRADWLTRLEDDLAALAPDAAGSQGRVIVPRPARRAPTDAERNVIGLETARYITADLAYRRDALFAAGGFDVRFRRAYREDSDVALRLLARGLRIVSGSRTVSHPVRRAAWHASLGRQRGNADDVLVERVHGRGWRAAAGAGAGRLPRHALITAAAGAAVVATAAHHRHLARALAIGAAAGVAEFAVARIAAGPRTPREVGTMLATSAALPPLAVGWHLAGRALHRRPSQWPSRLDAVLFDRDGTLIENVPYNGDPAKVRPLPDACAALDRLRSAGVRVGLVTNQSGVARGLISRDDVDAVHARLVELLGPFDAIAICPHGPDDGCRCRKPAPGLVLDALDRLGVAPSRAALIGDIGSDVEAARAAGVRGVLVPTRDTDHAEVAAAGPDVAVNLRHAVDVLLERVA
jgi:histidinol-phosphate phosphatase family protein